MKKFLFGILTFIGIGFSFCSAGVTTISGTYFNNSVNSTTFGDVFFTIPYNSFIFPTSSSSNFGSCIFSNVSNSDLITNINLWSKSVTFGQTSFGSMSNFNGIWSVSNNNLKDNISFIQIYFYFSSAPGTLSFDYICTFSGDNIINNSSLSSSSSTINVLYNNQQSTETITCDGDSIIQIDGLSTITNTNKFTPYFNINYRDEDNQLLTESYDKGLLTLIGNFKKTYTGNNERILTSQGGTSNTTPGIVITGDFPVFDYSGTISTDGLSGNLFTNFTDNALQVLLSNIPGYIQYVFIFGIILFILGLVKRLRGRK